jgi:hypothetical protein
MDRKIVKRFEVKDPPVNPGLGLPCGSGFPLPSENG